MKWIITGGAGFIGVNAARRLMQRGHGVVILDNLSRRGAERNLSELTKDCHVEFIKCDVRDRAGLASAFRQHADVAVVLHLAAQVAVTTSLSDPRLDFEVNACGTFNVCEVVRELAPTAALLNASTNKVYGRMDDVEMLEGETRYCCVGLADGIAETQPLDFHTPYGCSKGAGDQYVRDYHRAFGLSSVVFRQSCIYGPYQYGIEDQGWLAWFATRALLGKPITIYGDGKQVRDVLFVDDLVDCYLQAIERIESVSGNVYNVGGGPRNTLSVLEAIATLEDLIGAKVTVKYGPWRPGDQRVYVCDIRKAEKELGWQPRTSMKDGMLQMIEWIRENRHLVSETLGKW